MFRWRSCGHRLAARNRMLPSMAFRCRGFAEAVPMNPQDGPDQLRRHLPRLREWVSELAW